MRFPFLTSYLQLINLLTTIATTVVCCILVAIYYKKEYVYALIFFIVIGLCLGIFSWWYSKDISKNNVLWRFAGIALCGFVAKISVFGLWNSNFLIHYYWFTIFNVISICLYIPIHSFDGYFPYPSKCVNNLIAAVVLVVNCLALIIGFVYSLGFKNSGGFIFFQIYYTLFTFTAVDCSDGWKRFVESYKSQARERRIKSYVPDRQPGNQMLVAAARRLIKDNVPVPKYAPKNQTPKLSKCPSCSSDIATPRILTECGHTVCEECARKILDTTCKVKCPVCRQVTVVDETERTDMPVPRVVGPSAPAEELEDRRPENRTPMLFECPICTDEYSDTVTPRILTECGHTVCEECAWEILEEPYKIKCPVCSQVTIVDDIDEPSSVGPSAPVEELENRRPENRTPLHCECQICTEEYSDTTIPRILTQCGHTVCEECARKLLGDQGNITCPVCREETNVDGRVENLPKNFAVIEMTRGNLNA